MKRGEKDRAAGRRGEKGKKQAGGKRERSIRRKRVFVEIGKRAGRKKRRDEGVKKKV